MDIKDLNGNKVKMGNDIGTKQRKTRKDLQILKHYGNQVKNFNITVTNVMETDKELLSSWSETQDNQ